MKTSKGLVAWCNRAYNEKWGYLLGGFCQVLTPALLEEKMKQAGGVGEYNTRWRAYLEGFMTKRVTDCYGLIKGYIWTKDEKLLYKASEDVNQLGAYNRAKEKGTISTMPDIPGIILYREGHAGVYVGNGEFIECKGAPVGMNKGKVKGSYFTHWFKDTSIKYITYPDDLSPWALEAFEWVVTEGISDGLHPREYLTREEMWTMLYRMKGGC